MYDRDGSGQIDQNELVNGLSTLAGFSVVHCITIFQKIDINKSGLIDHNEFKIWVSRQGLHVKRYHHFPSILCEGIMLISHHASIPCRLLCRFPPSGLLRRVDGSRSS